MTTGDGGVSPKGRALITGAASRLGREMALALASDGYDVAIHYLGSEKDAAQTVTDLRALGATACALKADLLDEDQTGDLIRRASEGLGGPLTLLINNASIFEQDNLKTMSRESWGRAIGSNLRAPVRLTQDFAAQTPDAVDDANGEPVAQAVVINMIDQRVYKPTPFFMSYFVGKSGLLAFTKTAAQQLAPRVRVAGIGPGPTIIATRQSKAHFAKQRSACLLKRGSDPEDIVAAMRFIIECKAFTGQMLAVDGGQHLVWQTPDIQSELDI